MMRLCVFQHVAFEGPAAIEAWANKKKFPLQKVRLFAGDKMPALQGFDLLVVMGGPMNIYEHDKYPWLVTEKIFIGEAFKAGKKILGICLGAQLLSDVLGGKVTPNEQKEIGWFPVQTTAHAAKSHFFKDFPKQFLALHWHGDTFSIPPGATCLAETPVCKNQAFEIDGRALGLQFHLESTSQSIAALVENCSDELIKAPHIQSRDQILNHPSGLSLIEPLLDRYES